MTLIGSNEHYGIIGLYANQSADIADSVEPIEQNIVDMQIQLAYSVDAITQLFSRLYNILATARVLPKATHLELFRLGAWPR